MKRGYKSTISLLEEDLAVEKEILAKLQELTPFLEGKNFLKLQEQAQKNIDRLSHFLEALKKDDYQIRLICPICNWWIPFGTNPQDGDEALCEECNLWFRIKEVEGDFVLEKIGIKEASRA
jgi:uncharacterized protein YbaR (Trm112 family)